MTDKCKRIIPTISGTITFTDEWGNLKNSEEYKDLYEFLGGGL